MARIKLELKGRSPRDIIELARKHKIAMTGNAHFANPVPSEAEFEADLEAAKADLWEIASLKAQMAAARIRSRQSTARLTKRLNARASFIESKAEGDRMKAATSGLPVRKERVAITEVKVPLKLSAEATRKEGQVKVVWELVPSSTAYLLEFSPHTQPREWQPPVVTTKSKHLLENLIPGQRYAFRVRSIGRRNLTSDWSEEVAAIAT